MNTGIGGPLFLGCSSHCLGDRCGFSTNWNGNWISLF
jgi:hypothetical protein